MNYENLKRFLTEITDIVYKERIAVIGIILIFMLFNLGQFLYYRMESPSEYPHIEPAADMDLQEDHDKVYYPERPIQANYALSSFNPNTASFDQLLSLGFEKRTAHILINYREKGGRFYKREDLKKIYGLSGTLYRRLEPHILLPSQPEVRTNEQPNLPKMIDINLATATDLETLPGIGKYFANKIIHFRDKLGGFYSVDQIAETYHLPDSSFQKIKPYLIKSNLTIKKINVNQANLEILEAHPYISKWQAEDIIKNRPVYGLEDLYELYTFKNKEKNRGLEYYLDF